MGYEEIMRAATALPLEDRCRLRTALTRSINATQDTPPDIDPAIVIRTAEELTGGSIAGNRERRHVCARYLAVGRLRAAGLRHATVGRIIGCSRSEAYHCAHVIDAVRAVPGSDPELAKLIHELDKLLPL